MAASVSLSGCLVEKDKTPAKTYASNPNEPLHIYVPGNKITYDLQIISTAPTIYGTLEVKWDQTSPLDDPSSDSSFPVLKETTSIYYDGDPTNLVDQVVRYIEQEKEPLTGKQGTIYLRAIDDPEPTTHYWLNADGITTSGLDRFEIFPSPITLADTLDINFYVMENCSAGTCRKLFGPFSNYLTVGNDLVTIKGTRYGTFTNVYQVNYSGSVFPNLGEPLPFFDFLDICGTGKTLVSISHSGALYFVPEIGVIKIENTCTYYTEQPVKYIATIRSTDITLPPLTN